MASRIGIVYIAVVAAVVAILVGGVYGGRVHGSTMPIAATVGVVPGSALAHLQLAPIVAYKTSADSAVAQAIAAWHLAPGELDSAAGVVPAFVTLVNSIVHQHQLAWVMVADVPSVAPGTGIAYRKLVIVIDGITGASLYAYPVDPVSRSSGVSPAVRQRYPALAGRPEGRSNMGAPLRNGIPRG